MIKRQDKREATKINVEPNEGEPTLLSCNESSIGSPSLDFNPQDLITENILLDQLADILVDIFLEQEDAEYNH